jgi:hypothetical protein
MGMEVTPVSDARIRIRANRSTGELEIEGPPQAVTEWWERLWPEVGQPVGIASGHGGSARAARLLAASGEQVPDVFGEFYTEFRSDITDVDKVLAAAAFIQGRDQERAFTTKAANEALLDQNIKVTNASQCVRRLIDTKRVFVVSDGRYRVSSGGFEHLNSLKVNG